MAPSSEWAQGRPTTAAVGAQRLWISFRSRHRDTKPLGGRKSGKNSLVDFLSAMEECRHMSTSDAIRVASVLGIAALAQALVVAARAASADPAPAPAPAASLVAAPPLQQVVITAPLGGSQVPLDEVPASIQQISASAIGRLASPALTGSLNQLAADVNLNDTQGNPYQQDLSFRGFTASPVLGTPEGVSVYVDGVRVNEAFGDVVNWDLIPQEAISSLEVIAGANPVFGLNTLGGSVVITTRRGFTDPGTSAQVSGGSFGRHLEEAGTGGHSGKFDYYLGGTLFDERGWGDENPSRVRQGYGEIGYRDGRNDVALHLTYADNRLLGNQTLPLSLLSDPYQSYTWPDIQTNQMVFLDLEARHRLAPGWTLTGKAYFRRESTDIFNSNINGGFDPALPLGPGNEPTGNAIEGIDQYRPGGALQLAGHSLPAGHRNTLIIGVSYDPGWTDYDQLNQEAGASRATYSREPAVLGTLLHAANKSSGIYLSDTLGLTRKLYLNVGGRYNHASETLQDRLGTALNGQNVYNSFDPAVGLTFNPTRRLTAYASYDQGARVPTPMELTCADPNAPCTLPNAFSSDPPLKAVVARNLEIGARGQWGPELTFTASVFRTNLDNDIEFVAAGGGAINSGYFVNVGQTRRQGVSLGLSGGAGALHFSAHYSLVDATFQTPLTLNSPNNSTSGPSAGCPACTDIQVVRGDRIPGVPRNIVKLRGEYTLKRLTIGVDVVGQTDIYARGDENNQDVNGPVPGFVLVNLDARYELASRWRLFARIDNVLDRRYYTFGVLGQNELTGPGNTFDTTGETWRHEQFRTVGAPLGAWLGVAYGLGSD
jgi:iron complex outermembrane receptor protein